MATIALRAPGCGQPSRHRWHASHPSWVVLRTQREGEREERGREKEREVQHTNMSVHFFLKKLIYYIERNIYLHKVRSTLIVTVISVTI